MLFDKDYFAQFYVAPEDRTHVDTLILVGNGFDCWQGLDTSYRSFEKYYYEHIDEVLSKLHSADCSGHWCVVQRPLQSAECILSYFP